MIWRGAEQKRGGADAGGGAINRTQKRFSCEKWPSLYSKLKKIDFHYGKCALSQVGFYFFKSRKTLSGLFTCLRHLGVPKRPEQGGFTGGGAVGGGVLWN